MYSALYATDCQEKRLLILAITIAEVTGGVKNLSYWLPELYKEVIAPAPGSPKAAHPGTTQIPGNYRSFSQNGKFVLEIRRRSGYDQSLPVRPPRTEMGRFPQIVFQKNRLSKIRLSDALK